MYKYIGMNQNSVYIKILNRNLLLSNFQNFLKFHTATAMQKCKGHHCGKPNTCKCRRKVTVPIIWVLGGPGSGKGTQCERMVEKYRFTHISTGDLLRDEVASGSEKGKELAVIMKEGGLVSDDDVLQLLETAFNKCKDASGYLIDGYPRKKEQGPEFEKFIAPVDLILYYECSDDTLVSRILNRAAQSDQKRADDNEETIRNRIETFRKNSQAILDLYASKAVVINAERSKDEIFADSEKAVDATIKQKAK